MYSRLFTLFVSFVFVTSSLAIPSSPVVRSPVGAVEVVNVERQDTSSVLQVFQDLTTQGTPFINNLQSAVADPSNIDSDSLQSNLQGLIGVLTSSQGQLQSINPDTVDQSPASVNAIVGVFGPLLQLLLTVLGLVVGVIAHTPLAPIVLPLIATIGTLLAAVIVLAIKLVTGLLIALTPILLTLVAVLNTLGFTLILALIGL